MDESLISPNDQNNLAYNKQIKNLNDLIYIFKRMLTQQYNLKGYITITED
ncbi:MAG: hypothetical protein ACK521_03865 [bacterium]|jgi:hypothetical protein